MQSSFRLGATGAGFGLVLAGAIAVGLLRAADHRDSTLLSGNPTVDINDVYVFRSPANPANVVLAMTVSPFIAPSEAGTKFFEPDALYQFKIDTNGDAVEDLVIQAVPVGTGTAQRMVIRGPAQPVVTGTTNRVLPASAPTLEVAISAAAQAVIQNAGGISAFAGLRDDPFFFDLTRFQAILGGQASGFRSPGVDAFAGFNTLAIAVEIPASMLGSNPDIGIWGTTSRLK